MQTAYMFVFLCFFFPSVKQDINGQTKLLLIVGSFLLVTVMIAYFKSSSTENNQSAQIYPHHIRARVESSSDWIAGLPVAKRNRSVSYSHPCLLVFNTGSSS